MSVTNLGPLSSQIPVPTEGKQLGDQLDSHPALETIAPREQKARKETAKPGNCAVDRRLPGLPELGCLLTQPEA